jgi:glycerol-3-phosphate O-acyltransferase
VTRLQSAVEEKTSMAVSLKPEYEAAYEQTVDAIEKSMPEDKRNLLPMLSHFALEYLKASQTAYAAGQTENTDPVATSKRFLEGIGYGMKYGMPNSPDHYTFDVTHEALRGIPEKEDGNEVDYYAFGCDFFRPCMDISDPDKCVLGQDNLLKAMKQLEAGENVVFLANHQSEADPQVVSCCLEAVGQKKAAEDMIYVAGHKVTTDPLAIPFSMGRNLICIHSKKHINADAETKPRKQKQNLKAMNALLKALKKGGSLVWVAPSGGRDRRNVETGEVPLAPFDSKTIDMFRLMGNKSKVPTHYYTLAMVSYELCPPPDHVVAGTGEERNVRFVPVGIAVGDEVPSVGGLEKRHEFCEHAMAQCQADYEKLAKSLESLHQ